MLRKLLGYSPMTSNNQITLKENVRTKLNLKPGDLIGFYEDDDQIVVKKVKVTEAEI